MTDQPASSLFADRYGAQIAELLTELTSLRQDMVSGTELAGGRLAQVHPTFRVSAHNLLHYLALRRHDLRPLQQRLAALGLSSLGRAESHALASVDAVLAVLHELAQPGTSHQLPADDIAPDFKSGGRLLAEHSEAVLGPVPATRDVRIMVTLPSEAATDYPLVRDLLRQGMDCVRINCAHDDRAAWQKMIDHLRQAEQEIGKSCKVCMDLGGAKLRTTGLPPAPAVLRISPIRDEFGQVLTPARLWLTSRELPQAALASGTIRLFFPQVWLRQLSPGDVIRFRDARGNKRKLRVRSSNEQGCWAELRKTAYLVPSTRFRGPEAKATLEELPQSDSFILLRPGDQLQLTRGALPTAVSDGMPGAGIPPAVIGCALPEVLDYVNPGERIWFDDGKIGGVVDRVEPDALHVRITEARAKGEKLRNDKGINLPDSNLSLPSLTAKDLEDLAFVAQHADMVGLSFVSKATEVEQLQQHLTRLTERAVAIILKIETQRGFEQLPALLLSAMQAGSCGVMIARGDLAVECGFERLAEVQEEILWLCEAAHVPVIWATQVLESLASGGLPSRAEVTDAAMSDRAECVMLNKGPRVVQAVQTLDSILRRMQGHQRKKSAMLRSLHVAQTTWHLERASS
ncbi:pyruvate kinase [Hymenobacter sp. BT188]|uniref:pyruvate kinase n=1 Tax=Hymenobacter sp. BT188 TaxID=2763504 RepID=UPI0016515FC6|nr:pyruvate kinase [Hymenobacter sp. BT188]MBC6605798.1 pyruvate kinase [Hymenobacter sp. BT188]